VFEAAGEAIRPVSRVYLVRTFPQGYETYVLTSRKRLKSGFMRLQQHPESSFFF